MRNPDGKEVSMCNTRHLLSLPCFLIVDFLKNCHVFLLVASYSMLSILELFSLHFFFLVSQDQDFLKSIASFA